MNKIQINLTDEERKILNNEKNITVKKRLGIKQRYYYLEMMVTQERNNPKN